MALTSSFFTSTLGTVTLFLRLPKKSGIIAISLTVEGLVVSIEGLGARGVKGCYHGDVRWWARWFNGGYRMKVVKWNDGFVMKMMGIRG
ncbi:hypothetical protein V6N13_015018 [Hibiscus sabdariffa]